MQHVGRVDVLESPQDLVHKVLDVVDGQRLFAVNNAVQVRLHQVLHYIHVLELLRRRRRRDNINNADHLFDK